MMVPFLVILGATLIGSLFLYLFPTFLANFLPEQNLFRKYGGSPHTRSLWAVVTGGSNGIGLEYCKHAASQGFNLLIIALPDDCLAAAASTLRTEFPGVLVETLGVNFRDTSLCFGGTLGERLRTWIKDGHEVALLALNAGVCLFEDAAWGTPGQLDMLHINVLANMHVFTALYPTICQRDTAGRRGGVLFTSSCMGCIPDPYGAGYAASKAYLASYALSLGPEAALHRVDVLALCPGFVRGTHFTRSLPKGGLAVLAALRLISQTPSQVASAAWRALGRWGVYTCETGLFGWLSHLCVQYAGGWLLAGAMRAAIPWTPDYRRHIRDSPERCQRSR
ncbi:putative beta-keto acyl reductase [Paratrimastix pyriformis]|uniref:Beta-keto acyl reductase n=1 Tax=Paratrimastix pyriformis TaxID=342808 RepID=A0ABQ8ULR7_9EUKA|nr:putative beta-keto acyl reductase [Paratrimastix pyriformis]